MALPFGFPSRLVSINFHASGFAALEFKIELASVNDLDFISNFGASLQSNYPLVHGNMLVGAGPTFDDPTATNTALPWFHKTPKTQNNDISGSGTVQIIDRGLYDVMTDVGEVTFYAKTLPDGTKEQEIPYIIDFNGNNLGNGPPPALDGRPNVSFPPPPDRMISQADVFLLSFEQDPGKPNSLAGATVYNHHLLKIIQSHFESNGGLTDYDRVFSFIYLFNLSKIKAAVGNVWTLEINTSGYDDTGFARQTARWSSALSLWKRQKVFPQAASGALALSYARANDVAFINGPLPAEQLQPSLKSTYRVDIADLKVLSTQQAQN